MLTTLVALTGGVGAALIAAWATFRARRPQKSRVELVDVSLPLPDAANADRDHTPVLDVKVRNTGGQSAVLKRLVVHTRRATLFGRMPLLMPTGDGSRIGAALYVSETYTVTLPTPKEATGARTTIDLSQVVEPGGADRFLVRLGLNTIDDTLVYLLYLEVLYDGDDRKVVSSPLAVSFPQHGFIYSTTQIKDDIHRFQQEVNEVRRAIDKEMTARGLPIPDWIISPPRHRRDLPDGLLSVDGIGDPLICDYGDRGIYEVNENFWDPQCAIERHLRTIETMYRELIEVITPATIMHDVLRAALPYVHATLAQLPALHAQFCAPEKAITARTPTSTSDPDSIDQPARLLARMLAGRGNLEELRTRADAGDEGTIWFLDRLLAHQDVLEGLRAHTGADPNDRRLDDLLEDRLRARGPDHRHTLATRHNLARQRGKAGDAAGAATAFAELLEDQRRILGPDHPDTLTTRHNVAFWRGQAGHAGGAATAFAELLPDALRIHGPHHPATLNIRHELARWRGETGDVGGAASAFAELLEDRLRVQGPDHPHTLTTRHNLARWRGETGDVGGAASAFAELLEDQRRVLGPDHPDTLKSKRALAHWQEQPDQIDRAPRNE